MRVLVTGGAGFIGSHIVERLVAEGHRVRVLDSFVTGRTENLHAVAGDVELVEADIRSDGEVLRAAGGCEVVFHHAATASVAGSFEDPRTCNAVNVNGSLNVLLAARAAGVRRVVCASSSSVYGAVSALPCREDHPVAPLSPYAATKLAGEAYCRSFSEAYGLETVSLRYFNVFGPRQDPRSPYAPVVPSFITALLAGERPTIYGDGEQSRDFAYVDDIAAATVLAASAPVAPGSVFNVAVGNRTSLNGLLREIGTALGSPVEARYLPARPGEVRHSCADISAAERALGYRPRVTLAEGIRRTLPYYGQATTKSESGATA